MICIAATTLFQNTMLGKYLRSLAPLRISGCQIVSERTKRQKTHWKFLAGVQFCQPKSDQNKIYLLWESKKQCFPIPQKYSVPFRCLFPARTVVDACIFHFLFCLKNQCQKI